MIIIVENKEDRAALATTYNWIEDLKEKYNGECGELKAIYEARILTTKKEEPQD